jgi:dimethylaniline monooxygenase (N-oxide forming)
MSANGTGSPAGRKRVAVIGGGPAGLVTMKEVKEKGHEVVGFEQRAALGGVFTDTYDGLHLTSSSVITSFGSFGCDEVEQPVHWDCGEYLDYLSRFAEHFDLPRHYRLGTSVRSLRRAPEGGWRLRFAPVHGDGAEGEEAFDHVAVCCGSNMRPRFPDWADPAGFDGSILHSAAVRNGEEFAGKRVLVVGMGESGSDITLMAARVARASAISTRNGPGYVIPRSYRGIPADLDTNRVYHALPRSVVGTPWVRFKVRIEDALEQLGEDDQAVLRRMAEINAARGVPPYRRFATKSTAFIEAMVHHGTEYRPEVAELRRDRVVFTDGSEFRCDTIVCCTGFAPEFAFLREHEPELARCAATPRALYRRMVAPEAGADIAWIGYVRPFVGSVPLCAELQARYLALLVSGERSLPPREEMVRDARRHAELDLQQFPTDAGRLAALTDYFRFLETIAGSVGCRPRLPRLFLRHPRTALKVLCGPLTGAQYRLEGPGADPEEARATLRRTATMPWPVLAYELLLLFVCWTTGMTRERKRWLVRGARPAGEPAPEARPPLWMRIKSGLRAAGG